MVLGSISYAVAGLLFLLLTVLLIFAWHGRAQGGRFILACLATTLWAALLAIHAWSDRLPVPVLYLGEMLRTGAWLMVLVAVGDAVVPRWLKNLSRGLCGLVLLVALICLLFGARMGAWISPPDLFSHSGLALTICGLVLLEQIYRNSPEGRRQAIKPLVVGIGGLFAYDLFLYSQAELFHGIGEDSWHARGIVNALMAPLIAVAVRRNPQWALDLFVSRQVVFYTGAFVAAGLYLLLVAFGGYYVRTVGGSWGGMAQVVFLTGAMAVLASLLLSSSVRARAKVFLSKHFYRNKYDYRTEWLRFIRTLSSVQDDDVGRTALRAVAQIFTSPGGILFLAEEDGDRYVPVASWPEPESDPSVHPLRADDELTRFLRERQWIVDMREYREAPDHYGNLQLPDWLLSNPGMRLVSPLLSQERLIGFMVLYDPPPPFRLTYEDRDLLQMVGRHVAIQIAQHQADARLARSRQFETYNRLTAFMMHDLKNSAAQLQLLVANADKHKHNPEFIDDAISTIANTADRINNLIAQLRGEEPAGAVRTLDVEALVGRVIARCSAAPPAPVLESSLPKGWWGVRANPERLASSIENVVRNAQEATPPDGSVTVRLAVQQGEMIIEVADTGCGMDARFVRERLFKPFDSTKGSRGMGVGAYQVREYVRSLGGEVEVQSTPGQGTVFSIRLPACPLTNQDC